LLPQGELDPAELVLDIDIERRGHLEPPVIEDGRLTMRTRL